MFYGQRGTGNGQRFKVMAFGHNYGINGLFYVILRPLVLIWFSFSVDRSPLTRKLS